MSTAIERTFTRPRLHTKTPQYLEAEKAAFNAAVTPAMDKAVKSSADKVVAGIKPALRESFKASFREHHPCVRSSCQAIFADPRHL